jgi:hypothetical protein
MPGMDKIVRCTLCPWRGTVAEAAATRVQAAELPAALADLQRIYEEKQIEEEQLGGHGRLPHCPVCGNHTVHAKLHRSAAAV